MKLSEWAKTKGINYQTAFRMFKNNKIPYRTEQLPTGTILVFEDQKQEDKTAIIYARVSSHDQKEDLDRQVERLRLFCASRGLGVSEEVTEIASGMNSKRPKLNKILSTDSPDIIVVEHKDRLARFGFELIKSASKKDILLMNETESDMDLIQDFVDVVTTMCARIYGQRSAKNRAKRAIDAATK